MKSAQKMLCTFFFFFCGCLKEEDMPTFFMRPVRTLERSSEARHQFDGRRCSFCRLSKRLAAVEAFGWFMASVECQKRLESTYCCLETRVVSFKCPFSPLSKRITVVLYCSFLFFLPFFSSFFCSVSTWEISQFPLHYGIRLWQRAYGFTNAIYYLSLSLSFSFFSDASNSRCVRIV